MHTWAVLGRVLDSVLGRFTSSREPRRGACGAFGTSWGGLGSFLGCAWGSLGALWVLLEASRCVVEVSEGLLGVRGGSLEALEVLLGQSGSPLECAPQRKNKEKGKKRETPLPFGQKGPT
jgi:hypothetical protein